MDLAEFYLGKLVNVIIDRPMGSHHSEHGFLYLCNYGYIENTLAADGEELDGYVLGMDEPLTQFQGRCIAIIHRRDDIEDKLVVVADGLEMGKEEILMAVHFQEQYFDSWVQLCP